jgi:hypothetical protein
MTDPLTGPAERSNEGHETRRPTRIICYAWGDEYAEILLDLTLPALLAPGNLPSVAAEVPCTLIILTESRFFARFRLHPVIVAIESHCPVRFVKLDDLIVSKDKYGMSLTYVLHRAFGDLGPAMTEQWQIFLNADFILADGSLRNILSELARGSRIVAAPSYCVNAEATIPDLRTRLDEAGSLCISHRELAYMILAHRHAVIRGKTVNQQQFHMRYMDQFYWEVDDETLIGFQMPVAIVGLHPERYVAEPNSYWDYGLIREYCPTAEICVLGDSDQVTIMELRARSVAEDQIVPGPAEPNEIAQRMIGWVTPYQRDFVEYELTLHARDCSADVVSGRSSLKTFVDQVMSLAPVFPSHVKHPQWEYHWAAFHKNRPTPLRKIYKNVQGYFSKLVSRTLIQAIRVAKPAALPVAKRLVVPGLRRVGLTIIKTQNLNSITQKLADLTQTVVSLEGWTKQLESRVHELEDDVVVRDRRLHEMSVEKDGRISELTHFVTEYQLRLERSYDYQLAMAQDQIRHGMENLSPEFQKLYEMCRQYTMTSWERLYALYESVRYVVENKVVGDIAECGVWRGGSMKLVAHVLLSLGVTDRNLFLYDTFEGMTEPDADIDVDASGNKAVHDWSEIQRRGVKWSYAPIEEVQATIAQVGYPMERVKFIKGPVEDTIPAVRPEKLALLRLDTDWYSSTKHEMEHLYPLLVPQGVLILDDYGHYRGAARAVDEYIGNLAKKPLLQRVDYACRLAVKPVANTSGRA